MMSSQSENNSSQSHPPIPTPSFPSFVFRLSSSFRSLDSTRRPWSEFFDLHSLCGPPRTHSEAYSRVRTNLSYFRANYAFLVVLILVSRLFFHPLESLLYVLCFIFFFLASPTRPIAIFGATYNVETIFAFDFLLAFLILLPSILIPGFIVGFAFACFHAMFRVPDDLFYDCHQDPNLIPTKHDHDHDHDDDDDDVVSILRSIIPSSYRQNWTEFIDRNSLSCPHTLSEAYSRIHNNQIFFYNNYTAIYLIISFLSFIITDPGSVLLIPVVFTSLCAIYPSTNQPIVFSGCCTFPNQEAFFAFVISLAFVVSVGDHLRPVLLVGWAVTLAHSVFRVPQDLFFDCQDQDYSQPQEPSNHGSFDTNLIPMSDNSAPPPKKYDVFISFRGEDTRDNFKSHLWEELRRTNINTYTDDMLGAGENISSALLKAIEESIIYVIIFSEHYASSRWCLDELLKILECKERYGRDVIPIFYKVAPSTVRYQTGSYAVAFVNHKKRYEVKVKGWKAALTEAAALSGWDSNTIRPESTLVKRIVMDIQRRLREELK